MFDGAIQIVDAIPRIVFFQVDIFGVKIEALVLWMALAMVALTVYFGGVQFRYFFRGWRLLADKDEHLAANGVSPYRAFATSLTGAIGLGNIAGVAIAIAVGGPGAVLWMIVIALLAMPLKFAEAALGLIYRTATADGAPRGGPMYYLAKGFAERGRPTIGKALAIAYVGLALPTFFQFVQVNQAFSQFSAVSNTHAPFVYSIVFALAAAAVIFGGLKSIARASGVILPLMCGAYLVAACVILILNAGALPAAAAAIVSDAFDPAAGLGGAIGAFVVGMQRTVYSTEAGLGAAAVFHAASRRRDPVDEGFVAMLEPFIDTVIISTLTALVIIVTGAYRLEGLEDIQITSEAFNHALPGFEYLLAAIVTLFAFSTVVSYGYYFERIWTYVFRNHQLTKLSFRSVYCLSILPGPFLSAGQVIGLMDSFFFLLSAPNIIGLYYLAPELKRRLRSRRNAAKSAPS